MFWANGFSPLRDNRFSHFLHSNGIFVASCLRRLGCSTFLSPPRRDVAFSHSLTNLGMTWLFLMASSCLQSLQSIIRNSHFNQCHTFCCRFILKVSSR